MNKMIKINMILFSLVATVMLFSGYGCDSENREVSKENIETVDTTIKVTPETSKEVTIGKQVWMTENLNVEKFRNGDPIPQAKTKEEWKKASDERIPAWCYNDNDFENGKIYGKLYNWYAVSDPRGLAPEGWHVPSDEEWSQLTDNLGGESKAGNKIKSTSDWVANGNGTNESGFTGLPGGARDILGTFGGFIGYYGYWWSSTEVNASSAWVRRLNYANEYVERDGGPKGKGFSVRCLKD